MLTVFRANSVASAFQANLQRHLPERAADLVGIASRWSEFQRIARTMIVAAGLLKLEKDSIVTLAKVS